MFSVDVYQCCSRQFKLPFLRCSCIGPCSNTGSSWCFQSLSFHLLFSKQELGMGILPCFRYTLFSVPAYYNNYNNLLYYLMMETSSPNSKNIDHVTLPIFSLLSLMTGLIAVLRSLQECLPSEVNASSGAVGSDMKQVTEDIRYALSSLRPFNLSCRANRGGF